MISFSVVARYGSESRSANVGSLSVPTLASISAWIFFWTSGYMVMARRKEDIAETGCQRERRDRGAGGILRWAELAVSHSVGAPRVETGRGPLDLIFLFGRDLATIEQVRN